MSFNRDTGHEMGRAPASPKQLVIAEMVTRATSGTRREREEAFEVLMSITRTSVWRMHWAMWIQLPSHARIRREEFADEMTQETFIKAYVGLNEKGSQPLNFRVWIHKLGQRLTLDRCKAERREKRKVEEFVPFEESTFSANKQTHPGEVFQAKETANRLSFLLANLSNEKMREAFLLHLNTDLTQAEIGELLDLSTETIASYCARVRRVLLEGISS